MDPVVSPPAEGVRLAWADVPARVRAAAEERLGASVAAAESQPGGFSPGLAARLRLADGRLVFLKAAGPEPNEDAPRLHRREAAISARLPATAPAPRLLWTYDDGEGGWVALAFEDIDGRQPALPWGADELERVLAAMAALGDVLTPSPIATERVADWFRRSGQGWRRLREERPAALDAWSLGRLDELAAWEARAPAASRGDTLVHFDLRADNMLLTPERVVFVDWPHARVGAPWLDLVLFAPSVRMQGGPTPEAVLARVPASREARDDDVTAVLAAVAGVFMHGALQPAPPGLPTLRAFQMAQAVVARDWLARRVG